MTSIPEPLLPARMPLTRPKRGRWLTGVCKGIALHLGISVMWVRLAFIALTCLYGAGIIAYVFLWIFMPAGDPQAVASAEHIPVEQAPLARGNQPAQAGVEDTAVSAESLSEAIQRAPKPALVALAGFVLLTIGLLLVGTGADSQLIIPLLLGLAGIALAWMNLSPNGTQLLSMLGGIALIFMGWAIYVSNVTYVGWGTSPRRIMLSGFIMIACIVLAVMPWANAMLQRLSREQALKEREEERADMTAHLHDGVLQTLALIQLHSEDPATVFTLARGQERELREWLYQERSTSDRSVSAGLKQIAAEVEDEHGKPIEVVTVGDAHPERPDRCAVGRHASGAGQCRHTWQRADLPLLRSYRYDGTKCSCATTAKDLISMQFRLTGWASANRLSAESNAAAVQWKSYPEPAGAPK